MSRKRNIGQPAPKAVISQNQTIGAININGPGNTVIVQQNGTGQTAEGPTKEQFDTFLREVKKLAGSPLGSIEQEIRNAELANPGLSFVAQTTASQTTFIISPKPGTQSLKIGHLAFPISTEAGRRGLEKFRDLQDKGVPIRLEPDECKFESLLQLPWPKTLEGSEVGLSIMPSRKPLTQPVRLSCRTSSGRFVRVNLTNMSTLRAGRREIELQLSGGSLAGSIFILLQRDEIDESISAKRQKITAQCAVRVEPDWMTLDPKIAMQSANLLLAAHNGPIHVESLQLGKKLFSPVVASALPEKQYLEFVKDVLSCLIIINEKCGVHRFFRHPHG